jgi:hypothetical protein
MGDLSRCSCRGRQRIFFVIRVLEFFVERESPRLESCCCVEIPLEWFLKLLLKSFWLILGECEWKLADGRENTGGNTYLCVQSREQNILERDN